jgi:hypothetical protein
MLKATAGDRSALASEFFVGYVPGMEAQRFDIDRSARLIRLERTSCSKCITRRTVSRERTGRRWVSNSHQGPSERLFISLAAAQPGLYIAPGDSNAEARAIVSSDSQSIWSTCSRTCTCEARTRRPR